MVLFRFRPHGLGMPEQSLHHASPPSPGGVIHLSLLGKTWSLLPFCFKVILDAITVLSLDVELDLGKERSYISLLYEINHSFSNAFTR